MKSKKKTPNNDSKEKRGSLFDYPQVGVEELLPTVKRVVEEYSDVIPYGELSKIAGMKGNTRGGKFALFVKSMKLYELMDRTSYQEIGVTDFGKQVASDPSTAKNRLFKQFTSIPIFGKIYDKYPNGPPSVRSGVVHFVRSFDKSLGENSASRIVGAYYRDFEYFKEVNAKASTKTIEARPTASPSGNSKIGPISTPRLAALLVRVFPQDSDSTKEDLNELMSFSKENGLSSFSSFLEGLTIILEGKKDDELKSELKRVSKRALEKLAEDFSE